ncbi:C-C chemokine receptor type 6 [Chanos chanos]|uniref:C-C chemokine receptor type 6 n=1 Tax=Chanos chanos TaxID=29144 RepID=A0A6J2ULY1_CHACN|nr:C-C chemokine receptor type 6-like [Chanos chanos]
MEDDNMTYSYYDESDVDATLCDLGSNRLHEVTLQTYVYSAICVLGLVGNVLVLITYAFYKKAKTMTDVYLVNVAIADLLFVVALPLIIYNERYDWSMGTWACKLLSGIYSMNLYSSMLLLACISGDRYMAVVQARRSFGARSNTLVCTRLICTTIWVLAFILSLPTFIYYRQFVSGVEGNQTAVCNLWFDTNAVAETVKVLVPSLQVAFGFCVPLLVMGFCYSCIVVTLVKAKNFQRHKAVRVVLAVVIVFIICHLPYNVLLLLHTSRLFKERSCDAEKNILMSITVTKTIAYLHCCINPILYAFIGVKFRNHLYKIFQDLWCHSKKYIYSARSSRQTSDLYIPAPKSADGSHHENPSSFTM